MRLRFPGLFVGGKKVRGAQLRDPERTENGTWAVVPSKMRTPNIRAVQFPH